jgi:hypothetical protein
MSVIISRKERNFSGNHIASKPTSGSPENNDEYYRTERKVDHQEITSN